MRHEWIEQALMFIPWVRGAGDRRMRIGTADIVKTVITSAVVAGVVMYGTQRVLQAELTNLKQDFRDYKQIVDEIRGEQKRRKPMVDYVERRLQEGNKP